jgi:hypothetical protein
VGFAPRNAVMSAEAVEGRRRQREKAKGTRDKERMLMPEA